MAYQALYRKFRPGDFNDVKGQEHIVTTLKNQVKTNRIGHAYLFSGTRGTGKTTVAKILAKAVNCENPKDGNPCNECSSCISINKESAMNIIEIDGASHNKVDNMREIIEEVRYSPAQGRYKVYIIDEAHMVTPQAFNALLKTLEEPPSYVIFILATTDPHKILLTIKSRCQKYNFKRITVDTIIERLKEVVKGEGVEVEEKALNYIARVAEGSMRDAISLLDQCIAVYLGEQLTYDKVLNVLGAMEIEVYSTLLDSIIEQRVSDSLELLDKIIIEGRELTTFVNEFTWYLRNLLLVKSSEENIENMDISSDDIPRLKEQAEKIEMDTLIRYIHVLSELTNEIKFASQQRVLVEVALIKLMTPQMDTDYESLLERIRLLEEQVEHGVTVQIANNSSDHNSGADTTKTTKAGFGGQNIKSQEYEHKQEQARLGEVAKALPEDLKIIGRSWDRIVASIHPSWRPNLAIATPRVSKDREGNDNTLILSCVDEIDLEIISSNKHVEELKEVINKTIGKDINLDIQFKLDNNKQDNIKNIPDLTKLIKNIKIEYED